MGDNLSGNPATHFGRQVRKERRARGWSIYELAKQSGISAGHLSHIENGNRQPTAKIAAAMDQTFPGRKGWFTEFYLDSQKWTAPGYRHWSEYELKARHIRAWCPGMLHGLVQTEKYARAHLETVPCVPAEVVEARLAARMERQRRVLHRENPPLVSVLVDELALYRFVGSAETMAEQMDHVLDLAKLPDVTVQVVPAVMHAATASEVIAIDDAAYAEHVAGGFTYTEPETVTPLTRLVTTIQAESLRASESCRLIEGIRDVWASGASPLTVPPKAVPASK